jgi:CheY-like chemotaxis protein
MELAGDVPMLVSSDPTRLRQVLLNLCSNAVKFTQTGFVTVRLIGKGAAGKPLLRFEVRDSGIGIAESIRHRLFKEFSQADASVTRRYGGTGLGLAICKRILAALDGEIGVVSREGAGSLFWFEVPVDPVAEGSEDETPKHRWRVQLEALPDDARQTVIPLIERQDLIVAAEPPYDVALCYVAAGVEPLPAAQSVPWIAIGPGAGAATSGAAANIDGVMTPAKIARALAPLGAQAATPRPSRDEVVKDTRPLTILVAEDNVTNQRVMGGVLERFGHRYDIAGNGRQAVELVGRNGYDLVFMDMQMPEMDGLEATRAIRALPGAAARVPILAMTANAFTSDRDACLAAGMDGFLSKPIDRRKLAEALAEIATKGKSNAATPFDPARLEELTAEIGEADVAEILATFRRDADQLTAAITDAIARNDAVAFRTSLHTLEGAAANVGASACAAACRQARQEFGQENLGQALRLASSLLRLCEVGQSAVGRRH